MTRVTFTILFDKYLYVGLTWSGLCLLAKIWSIINDYTNNIFPLPILHPAQRLIIGHSDRDGRSWKVIDGHGSSWKVMEGVCVGSGGDGHQDYIDSPSPILTLDWDFLYLNWTEVDLGLGFVLCLDIFFVALPVPPHCSQFKYRMFFFPRNKIHLEIFWTSSSNQMRQSSHII